ncbi:MAG TPA: alpha-L-rhamnosidase C-terminal domain-containing protein [Sedimentisphaerales bacterium]|nr:alpha-L-rhamnosidase C-terminal domain-containing protein [Sedimentisphaerales bacterium]
MNSRLDSMYGPIEAEWHLDGKALTVKVEIPPNTMGTVKLPSAKLSDVTEGGKPLSEAGGIHILQTYQEGNTAFIPIGSGRYVFRLR